MKNKGCECEGAGFVGDNCSGIKGNNEYEKYICGEGLFYWQIKKDDFVEILERIESGYFCKECENLCTESDQGLFCDCEDGWSFFRDSKYYPDKWVKVKILIQKV